MASFVGFFRSGLSVPKFLFSQVPMPSIGQITAVLSIFGLACTTYLAGATIMYFQLAPGDGLRKAFQAIQAWSERRRKPPDLQQGKDGGVLKIKVDKPGKTYDGYTLYTGTKGSQASLIDMRGNEVHHWEMPFSHVWQKAPQATNQLSDDRIHWFHTYLYPDGDLLAVYHAEGDTPYGYGLVKLDKDSQILWSYAACVHHDVDVGEDGTIYTLTHELIEKPDNGPAYLPDSYLADTLVVLSPYGKELEKIPLLETFQKSPYAPILLQSDSIGAAKGDIMHTNCVKVLNRSLASKFPLFQPGQVLISMRSLNSIAVIDVHTHSIVWAASGLWRGQHDPEFLDNGHILLYDNSGSKVCTRILEYDPVNQAMPRIYANENATSFRAPMRGMKQHLPNGGLLIMDPDAGRIFEVNANNELVWECFCPSKPINSARRYGEQYPAFLPKDVRARP